MVISENGCQFLVHLRGYVQISVMYAGQWRCVSCVSKYGRESFHWNQSVSRGKYSEVVYFRYDFQIIFQFDVVIIQNWTCGIGNSVRGHARSQWSVGMHASNVAIGVKYTSFIKFIKQHSYINTLDFGFNNNWIKNNT